MFFVRPGELRKARWADFDLDAAEWRYHVTKTKTEHLVPLSKQAVEILRELQAKTGNREHVFPRRNPRKPMSDAAINAALRRMGYDTKSEITGHGFRAMARTILHQELHFAPELIEHQLAHRVPDSLGTAYNRTKFIDQRRAMMQSWSDYLERLKAGAKVIVIRGRPAFLREMPMLNGPEREVLTFNALLTILGRRSRRSIYDLMRRDPTLPRPRQIGSEFSVGWLRGEVMEWLNARPPVRCADVTQRSVSPRTGGSDSPVLTLANICQRFPRTCAFGDLARAALKRYLRHAQVSCAYPV
jgi:predicted DNA-binding transcriptional regulator AlpA